MTPYGETPNTKLQTPENLQIPSLKRSTILPDANTQRQSLISAWDLGFLWALDLVFGTYLVFGVWCLVFNNGVL